MIARMASEETDRKRLLTSCVCSSVCPARPRQTETDRRTLSVRAAFGREALYIFVSRLCNMYDYE